VSGGYYHKSVKGWGGEGGWWKDDYFFGTVIISHFLLYRYFSDGVWVRKTDHPDAPFYSSRRIDFELYT
jgi:hypothetical protein